ncbi:MAG: hypothetical protein RL716_923 [Actinomycetota bacterium]|jgi:hypothetical protein|uniref:hypothetical protein n=1 Tax=Rhodoluna sp. TaxID=1969481 RepID=UPI0025FA9A57|nr:hypothetical protein [Rhodoluna sp.]
MKWLVFVGIAVGILLIFTATYAISNALDKKRRPKTTTLAPDDDPQFLRDLREKLNGQNPEPDSDQEPKGDDDSKQ